MKKRSLMHQTCCAIAFNYENILPNICMEIIEKVYVGKIARGERMPVRGKGLKVKNRLMEMAGELITN